MLEGSRLDAAPETWWRKRLSAWLGPALEPELREAFAAELAETNRRRLAVLLPLVLAGHAVHIAVFYTTGQRRALLDPQIVRWRDGIAAAHFATLLPLLLFAVVIYARRGAAARWVGPAAAAVYLVHGAAVAGIDQLVVTAITPFMGYCLGMAVVLVLTPRATLLAYGIGLTAFLLAIVGVQPSASARLAIIPNGVSTAVVSATLACLLYVARRRDFVQRVTIDRQREALAELNSGLERRVAEQVSEIVKHAEEADRLNAQLQAQVRERSNELALALSKLAKERRHDGRLRRGAVLGERFEIEQMIGEGGMGVVYSGFDRTTGERVALKVVQAASSQLDAVQRFLREARAAATVTHPGIVRMLHVDVSDDGTLFQAQELVRGEVLDQRLRRGSRWEPRVTARFGAVLCDALAAAHAHGIVHRDVKPGNVMLTLTAPGLKLLDFGISKLHQDTLGHDDSTREGTVLGTPAYMAPEQLLASPEVSDRADVYAVGVMMFQMLTGKSPFGETVTPLALALSQAAAVAPDARSLEPSVPPLLAELVARCLCRAPEERPSALALGGELSVFADGCATPPLHTLERDGVVRDRDSARSVSDATAVRRSGRP